MADVLEVEVEVADVLEVEVEVEVADVLEVEVEVEVADVLEVEVEVEVADVLEVEVEVEVEVAVLQAVAEAKTVVDRLRKVCVRRGGGHI